MPGCVPSSRCAAHAVARAYFPGSPLPLLAPAPLDARSEIRAQLAMLMGGRAAEHLTCAAVSTGAADDIRRATDLAYRAISVRAKAGLLCTCIK
jgi:hypothetical protein